MVKMLLLWGLDMEVLLHLSIVNGRSVKVCLVEEARQWEPHDFATDSFKIMSAVRTENRNSGFSFGPKDALFRVISLVASVR